MNASDLVERPAPGRILAIKKARIRGMRLRLSGPGRFALVRDAGLSALLWAGVPAAMTAVYLFVFAADQLQSESKFVVRGDTFSVGSDGGGTLGNIIEINTTQDTRIAADYVASGAVLSDLKSTFDLAQIFAAPGLDLFAGLPRGATREQLTDYWRGMVSADVDAVSGIITLKTRAFTAEDARALNSAAIVAAEGKLNVLHRLTLQGGVDVASERAANAAERLKAARLEIKVFRERYRAIDLKAGASSTFELLSELRRQRIAERGDLAVLRAQGASGSPSVRALEARIAAVDGQIVELEKQLTGAMDGDQGAASAAIEAYDRLVLRQDLAAQYVARTEGALGRAERRLDKRSIYLEVFVPPAAPSEASFPKRTKIVLTIFAAVLAAWGLIRLVWAGIRSHDV